MSIDKPSPTNQNYPMPFLRVDLVVLAVSDGRLKVLLSHRKEAPFKGKWGLPGGVLRIDLDASLENAAQRVAMERLNRSLPNLTQVAAVGGADRDPRAPWAVSVVFRSLVDDKLETVAGKRVLALNWKNTDEVQSENALAFDHTELVAKAVDSVRRDIRELRFPKGWMPEEFTLSELQAMSEAVLGERLDKVTFRRRIEVAKITHAIEGKMKVGGAHRPAQLMIFND